MLTQISYESKHIRPQLSPLESYNRRVEAEQIFWDNAHTLAYGPMVVDVPSPFAVDEDELCFDFGLVAVGEDDEGVTIFDYKQDPFVRITGTLKPEPVGCVASIQRGYEPWPDLGWGTHATSRRYPVEEPWVKFVPRGVARKRRRAGRRKKKVVARVREAFVRGVVMSITKPGSQHRSGVKHHKDEARRVRPRKKIDRKRHRRVFDSTLGYPGEGPPRPIRRGRWRPAEQPECHDCKVGRLCGVNGHWHRVKGEAKSGAPRRMLERQQREQKVERKLKFYTCSHPFPDQCDDPDHLHDANQLVVHPQEEKYAQPEERIEPAILELPDLEVVPDGPVMWVDQEPEDYVPQRRDEAHILYHEPHELKTFDDPPRVEAIFDGVDHKHMIREPLVVPDRAFNYCRECEIGGGQCLTPGDDANILYYLICPDCAHDWDSHRGDDGLEPDIEQMIGELVPDLPPFSDDDESVVGEMHTPQVSDDEGEILAGPGGVYRPRVMARRDPQVHDLDVVPPPPRITQQQLRLWFPRVETQQHFDSDDDVEEHPKVNPDYVVDLPNYNYVETRVLYQVGDHNESACCNVAFACFSRMPCTVVEDDVLVNEWRAALVSEVQGVEATNTPAVRFKGFFRRWGSQRKVPGVNNYVKFFTHATRSPIYVALLEALMKRKEIMGCTLMRSDGSTVSYLTALALYIAARLVRADGFVYHSEWGNNNTILQNTIVALMNQLYIRDVRFALAVPPTMSVRPAFQRTGLYLHFRDAMAPIVSVLRSVW